VTIYRLLQNEAFGPQEISVMSSAYEDALRALDLVDRSDPLTDLVAKRIIEFAQRGERDAIRLRHLVLASLKE
jgi:hypothetical protein